MLEFVKIPTTIDGNEITVQLPFVNLTYRSNVRVVDFSPSMLEDFAHAKKFSEYDVLSDNEASESDSSSDQEHDSTMESTNSKHWEWRFFLQLENAHSRNGRERIWVAVDNSSGQCLLGLDASNLRRDRGALETLREKLFLLWGNLEEHKRGEQEKKERRLKAARQGKPPEDSGDEAEDVTKGSDQTVMNRPFSCCIRQYGVKVGESDPAKADAGEGKRWQRIFSLFGTKISG